MSKLPPSFVFREASSRDIIVTLARYGNLNVVFDPGVPRGAGHHRAAQRQPRGRADLDNVEHAYVLQGHGTADDHHRSRHAGQAARVRRRNRSHLLPEQRRSQGDDRSPPHRRRPAAHCRAAGDERDHDQGFARSRGRRLAHPGRDRQGPAGGGDRRRVAGSGQEADARSRASDRVARIRRRASTDRRTSTSKV